MKYIYTLLALAVVLAISLILQNSTHQKANAKRLPCHKKTVVFERLYDQALLKKAQNALQANQYLLDSSIRRSVYMKSRLFEYVSLDEVDTLVQKSIAQYHIKKPSSDEKAVLEYYIYENDKADPGKKTAKSKKYAGYLRFTLKYQGKRVYAVQVDFMGLQGQDIGESITCAIQSIFTIE